MSTTASWDTTQIKAFYSDPAVAQALLDLTVIEDNHPTHIENDFLRSSGRGSQVVDKALLLEKVLRDFRDSMHRVATGRTPRARSAAANKACDELASLIHFLTAYSFDSARRFAVMHQALKPLKDLGEPREWLLQNLKQDDTAINEKLEEHTGSGSTTKTRPLSFVEEWKVRARRSWSRLDLWHRQAQP